jgi:hypothetical protein
MRNWHVRAYRALLRIYPRRFRADYEEEMCRVFAQQLHYARVTEGWTGALRVWVRSLVDLVTTAPTQHFEKDVLVASPVGAGEWQTTSPQGTGVTPWALAGLGPVWAVLAWVLLGRGNFSAVFLNPPGILGLPAGMMAIAFAFIWGLLGLGLLTVPRSPKLRAGVLVLFVVPAVAELLIPSNKFGLPMAVVALGFACLWWWLGRPPTSDTRLSTFRVAVLLLFTAPATALVLLAPAVVLVLRNLTV